MFQTRIHFSMNSILQGGYEAISIPLILLPKEQKIMSCQCLTHMGVCEAFCMIIASDIME